MEKAANEPLEPTKPPEIDPELNATAATAVEQWRNYQQAYAAYQQQYAAYQQYIQQRQYAQTVEQQQVAYTQYLERHSQYQYQLQQYEQQHRPAETVTSAWPAEAYAVPSTMIVQQPVMPAVHPAGDQLNGYPAMVPAQDAGYVANVVPTATNKADFPKGTNRRRFREPRAKARAPEKKSELHTKTVVYVNPEDETMLPADLKNLFKEFQCDLCRTRMNSHISANIHYQSKAHEKKITQWLKEYCMVTGTPMPVRVRRKPELASEVIAVAGDSVFHCSACDLPLTSIQHANQHYTGKRHALVVNGKKLPSGNGYYNAEGKWIRSANIATDETVSPSNGAVKRPAADGPLVAQKRVAKQSRLEPPPVPPKELITGLNWASGGVDVVPSTSTTMQPIAVVPTTVATVVNPVVMVSVPASEPRPPLLTINVESDDDEKLAQVPVIPPREAAPGPPAPVTVAASVAPFLQQPLVSVFSQPATAAALDSSTTTGLPNTTAPSTLEQEIRKKEGMECVDDTGTFCLICETSVTSRSEMLMHLKGAKHIKKARMKGMVVRNTSSYHPGDTILRSLSRPARKTDWSLYRMPTGKFYCKTCNLIVSDEKLFGQHWYGKKHKLKMRQENAAQYNSKNAVPVVLLPDGTTATDCTPDASFASDEIDLGPAAYHSIVVEPTALPPPPPPPPVEPVATGVEAESVLTMAKQSGAVKPSPKRHGRPFFPGKRGRFGKPRKRLPVAI